MAGVTRDLQVALFAFVDGDGGNIFMAGIPDGDVEFDYYLAEYRTEYLANVEIPPMLMREAVEEFLQTSGSIPACVEWKMVDSR